MQRFNSGLGDKEELLRLAQKIRELVVDCYLDAISANITFTTSGGVAVVIKGLQKPLEIVD